MYVIMYDMAKPFVMSSDLPILIFVGCWLRILITNRILVLKTIKLENTKM